MLWFSPKVNTFYLTYRTGKCLRRAECPSQPWGSCLEGYIFHQPCSWCLYFEAVLLLPLCCKASPGSIPPAAGLQNPNTTAQELLTEATYIPKDSGDIFQKTVRYPVICSYCIQNDAASHRSVLLSQNKWSEIQGKSSSLQLFTIRSQSPDRIAVSIMLSVAPRCSCVDVGSQELCGFPPRYLKDGPQGQMLCLALEILSEEWITRPCQEVFTICCRCNIDEVLNWTWPFHDAFICKAHKQDQMQPFRVADAHVWSGSHDNLFVEWILPGFPQCAGARCGRCVSLWCHHCASVPLWPRCRNFGTALLAGSHPDARRSLSHSSSSLLQGPGSAWQVQSWSCAEAEPPELLGRTSTPFYYIFWRMEVFCRNRKKWEGRTAAWGDTAGVGKRREQAAARDAAAEPEPAEHRDQSSSGKHGHRLPAGKTRWCRSWGRNTEPLFEGLCQEGGTKG